MIPSVVIVTEDADLADVLADAMGRRGFRATPVAAPREARAVVAREPFDAIVADLRMADEDGLTLVTCARRRSPAIVAVLLCSSDPTDPVVAHAGKLVDACVVKPFRIDELLALVRRGLHARAGALHRG